MQLCQIFSELNVMGDWTIKHSGINILSNTGLWYHKTIIWRTRTTSPGVRPTFWTPLKILHNTGLERVHLIHSLRIRHTVA